MQKSLKTTKFFNTLIIAALSFILSGCGGESSVERWIDNPTDQQITISIDNKQITIPAQSGIDYSFEYGKHSLTYNGSTVNFMVIPSKMTGFVNPTQSNYIFYKTHFVNQSDNRATESYLAWLERQITSQTEVILNGQLQTLSVPFVVVNDLFVHKTDYNWDYYLDDPMPNSVVLTNPIVTSRNRSLANDENYKAGKFQTTKSKIFREKAFIEYLYTTGLEDEIAFPQNKTQLADLTKFEMVKIDLDRINCPPGKEAVINALAHWNKWITMSGSDLSDEHANYIRVIRTKELTPQLEALCYEDYNGDYSFKQEAHKIMSKINELHNRNFIIVN